MANNRDGTLTGIDVDTSQPRTIDTGHATLNIAASDHELMVAVGPTADDIIGTLEGSILTLATEGEPWLDPSPDPPNNWNYPVRQVEYLTCVGLLAYPDAPASVGWELRPEAAKEMPTVSSDGRTYTFTIRPGLQFSPPSDEPITAETFRASIERALSPELIEWAPGPALLDDIVGAKAFREGTASSVAGLAVDGDRLAITLEAPAPDFLGRVSLPFYCPVPAGTPPARLGLDADPPVAGSGPYYLANHTRYRLVVLKKNPNYQGDRPQPFDAIAIHLGTSVTDLVAGVKSGRFDGALVPGGDSIVGPGGRLEVESGPASEAGAAGNQRWFGARRAQTSYIALNPNRPAFKDLDVRRAVALALDRAALARIWPNGATASLLPPTASGPTPAIPAPDLDGAKVLMAGRTLAVTMALWSGDCPPCQAFATETAGQLQAIGITVNIVRSDDPYGDAMKTGSTIDLFEGGMGADVPDIGTMLRGLSDVTWLPRSTIDEIERIQALSGQARLDASYALARGVTESAMVIPYGADTYVNYFGAGIGCAFVQPAIGAVDLLTLCKTIDPGQPSAAPSP